MKLIRLSQNVFDNTVVDTSLVDKKLIIPSRVIFDVRMNANGSVNKYKARLVAQGNHQDSSTYFNTFADTLSMSSYVLRRLKIWKFQL